MKEKTKGCFVGLGATLTSRRQPGKGAGWKVSIVGKAAKGFARARVSPVFPSRAFSVVARIDCRAAANSSAGVVSGRVVMETFGEAERSRLMPSVMCVQTAISFFLSLSFSFLLSFFFSLREPLGSVPLAPNVFPY